jgi:hypothetical protein
LKSARSFRRFIGLSSALQRATTAFIDEGRLSSSIKRFGVVGFWIFLGFLLNFNVWDDSLWNVGAEGISTYCIW